MRFRDIDQKTCFGGPFSSHVKVSAMMLQNQQNDLQSKYSSVLNGISIAELASKDRAAFRTESPSTRLRRPCAEPVCGFAANLEWLVAVPLA